MIKAVLFDFDGTFMNTRDAILNGWRYIFDEVKGITVSEKELATIFRVPMNQTLKKYFPEMPVEESMEIYKDYQIKNPQKRVPFKGMPDLVRKCYEEGYKIGLVTSRQLASSTMGLKKSGVFDCFSSLVTAETCENHKPSKDPIVAALNDLHVAPGEAVMIGDSISDLESGKNAEVPVILVGWTQDIDLKNPPEHCLPYAICHTPEEIFKTVKNMK